MRPAVCLKFTTSTMPSHLYKTPQTQECSMVMTHMHCTYKSRSSAIAEGAGQTEPPYTHLNKQHKAGTQSEHMYIVYASLLILWQARMEPTSGRKKELGTNVTSPPALANSPRQWHPAWLDLSSLMPQNSCIQTSQLGNVPLCR